MNSTGRESGVVMGGIGYTGEQLKTGPADAANVELAPDGHLTKQEAADMHSNACSPLAVPPLIVFGTQSHSAFPLMGVR